MAQEAYDDYDDRYDDDYQEELDRREYRRRRRKRNQAIAIVVAVVLLLAIAGGIFYGVTTLVAKFDFNFGTTTVEQEAPQNTASEEIVIEAPMEQ